MKCTRCGHWNRATFTRCFKCGQQLLADTAVPVAGVKTPDWQKDLRDGGSSYVYVNDIGEAQSVLDRREALAQHMADLKKRKIRGEQKQRELRTAGSRRGLSPSSLQVTRHTTRANFFTFDAQESGRIRELTPHDSNLEPLTFFDSMDDSASMDINGYSFRFQNPNDVNYRKITAHRIGFQRYLRSLLLAVSAAAILIAGYLAYGEISRRRAAAQVVREPIVTASMQDDLAAHTIMIPGEEGTQIYIRELRLSYEVSGGYATVEVPDHLWYDDFQDYLQSTMTVVITPSQKMPNGQQKPLPTISYDVDIPLSTIELLSPDITRLEVSVMMYTIVFRVQENSTVYINNENLTDMVNLDGEVTYNATVQPIGDNLFVISVRSQHCRENKVSLVLYRAKQEIPLDLASDTSQRSSSKNMMISATTIPGSVVNVQTPHTDLDITHIDATGSFSFYAVFDHIGYNTITVTADYPGKEQSVLNHVVYYVPPAAEYTRTAWDVLDNYADLLANNAMRVSQTRNYVCKGTIERIVSEKPQLAIMNVGTVSQPRYVLLENNTRNTWLAGAYYRIFGDAYGMYDDMPRLQARYTYLD